MSEDFLYNVETAFLALFASNSLLKQYNLQRRDSDIEVKLPRVTINIDGRRDPEASAIFRLNISMTFEGKPKHQKLSVVMNELKSLFSTTQPADLDALSGNTVNFFGNYAEEMNVRRADVAGLRTWVLTMVLFACSSG